LRELPRGVSGVRSWANLGAGRYVETACIIVLDIEIGMI